MTSTEPPRAPIGIPVDVLDLAPDAPIVQLSVPAQLFERLSAICPWTLNRTVPWRDLGEALLGAALNVLGPRIRLEDA